MSKERAPLNLDDELDLSGFEPKQKNQRTKTEQRTIEAVAKKSGFISRQPKKRHRRRVSPYTDQLGVKVRQGMKELFQAVGERMEVYDHTTFERALLALIEQEGYSDLKKQFTEITK